MQRNGNTGTSSGLQPDDPEGPIRLATFDQYRSLLFSLAYRMLGSVADAEDMLQETFIYQLAAGRRFLGTWFAGLLQAYTGNARAGFLLMSLSLILAGLITLGLHESASDLPKTLA